MAFKNIIENMTKTSNVEYYMIHLERATERLQYIKSLEEHLSLKLNIFEGADGYKLIKDGHPVTCQQRGPPAYRGPGDIGCTVSHINICKDALTKNYDYIVIFEDDCILTSDLNSLNNTINEFIKLNRPWDLFLIGCSQVSSSRIENTNFYKINRFNGTHTCILSKIYMKELVKTYENYYNNNTTFAIDGMYSNVIEDNKLNAYCFGRGDEFFIQKPGVFSYIIERVR